VASVCDVCGKQPGFGNKAVVGRTPKRLNVCTSCIKAGKVTR